MQLRTTIVGAPHDKNFRPFISNEDQLITRMWDAAQEAVAKDMRRRRRRATRQESLRRRYGGFSPKAFPLDDISGAANPPPEEAPDRREFTA